MKNYSKEHGDTFAQIMNMMEHYNEHDLTEYARGLIKKAEEYYASNDPPLTKDFQELMFRVGIAGE